MAAVAASSNDISLGGTKGLSSGLTSCHNLLPVLNSMHNNGVFNTTHVAIPDLDDFGFLETALDDPNLDSDPELQPPDGTGPGTFPIISEAIKFTPSFLEFVSSKEALMLLVEAYVTKYGPDVLGASTEAYAMPGDSDIGLGMLTQTDSERVAPKPPDNSTLPYPVLPSGAVHLPLDSPPPMMILPPPPAPFGLSHALVAFDTNAGNHYGSTGLLPGVTPVMTQRRCGLSIPSEQEKTLPLDVI
ncbi:hypothetical protein GY45DRAFT_1340184 [Cubamyces sp. BRFM 1775]|nr:hypothetical protein GY45DRAFT_1340184 [Cubamyces sp. BRFM 1775]